MSALSEVLREANTEKQSTRTLAAKAARAGHPIDFSTISLYLRGKHGQPDEETLLALSAAFGVPLSKLREASGLPTVTEPFVLPAEASRLSRKQREAVMAVVSAFLDRGEGEGSAEQPAPNTPEPSGSAPSNVRSLRPDEPQDPPARAAARKRPPNRRPEE